MTDTAVIITPNAIIANGIYNEKRKHVTIPQSSPLYAKAIRAYKKGHPEEILRLGDLVSTIQSYGKFYVSNDQVYLEDLKEPAPKILSDRIIAFAKEDLPVTSLLNFWNKLQNNVTPEVREQLYGFLEHNNIPITSDGCFIAYKAVTKDKDGNLWDSYTFNADTGIGTYRNNVGDIVEMNREDVDSDPNVTCSHGLHAAAFDYAYNTYGNWVAGKGEGIAIVHVKIDPLNVCSIPTDYNFSKLRCCRYSVIEVSEDFKPIERPLFDADQYDWEDEEDDYDDEDSLFEPTDTSSVKTTDVVDVQVRTDGSVEIPAAFTQCNIWNGKSVTVTADPITNTVRIVKDTTGTRYMKKGFRVSHSTLQAAEIDCWTDYVIEVTDNQITISVN